MSDISNLSDFLFIHSKHLPFIYTNLIGFLVLAFKEMIGFEPSIQPFFFFFFFLSQLVLLFQYIYHGLCNNFLKCTRIPSQNLILFDFILKFEGQITFFG